MRLIDADALPKYTGYALSANEVAVAVENAPTIDAVPVRHGKTYAILFLIIASLSVPYAVENSE